MKKQLLSSSSLTHNESGQNESGRSMVEMLGVLAIIGVLSVGGVSGYGRAITAHRANTAVETAQREAAIIAGEIATGQKVEPGSAPLLKASSGYEVAVKDAVGGTTDITNTTPFFGVEVGGGNGQKVQREVAKSVVERAAEDWTNVHGIGVISGEGESRTIKWLKSAGTGANGFETEVPESAQTVILIIVYASDLAPRTGDLLTDFNVTPIDDAPTTCPAGTDTSYSGGHAVTLKDGSRCYCDTETVWNSDSKTCDTKPDACTSYLDCNKGEFCCGSASNEGTCNPINITSEAEKYYTGQISSECVLDLQISKDFCEATGGRLANVFDFCTPEERVFFNTQNYGRCTKVSDLDGIDSNAFMATADNGTEESYLVPSDDYAEINVHAEGWGYAPLCTK